MVFTASPQAPHLNIKNAIFLSFYQYLSSTDSPIGDLISPNRQSGLYLPNQRFESQSRTLPLTQEATEHVGTNLVWVGKPRLDQDQDRLGQSTPADRLSQAFYVPVTDWHTMLLWLRLGSDELSEILLATGR